jgi:hypothetical protein
MKHWIKTAGLRAGLAAMALALGANTTHAALLERDLLLDRDHAITYDTDTQFEWLDLTKTEGLNYNDALASKYVTEFGFHIATVAEVLQLWADVGVTPGDSYENSVGGIELINLLGCTAQCVRYRRLAGPQRRARARHLGDDDRRLRPGRRRPASPPRGGGLIAAL